LYQRIFQRLPPGEELVWQGRPSAALIFLPIGLALPTLLLLLYIIASVYRGQFPALALVAGLILGGFTAITWRHIGVVGLLQDRFITWYGLTNQRLILCRGWLVPQITDVELAHVRSTGANQGWPQQMVNLGDVVVEAGDPQQERIILHSIYHPEQVKEHIRTLAWERRASLGYRYVFRA
jgi:hypothetical protein